MTEALGEALPAALQGNMVVALAQNVLGPAAAARLQDFSASVTEVEPPNGDPLAPAKPAWDGTLAAGQEAIFAGPLRYETAKPGVPLGGGFPGYGLYKTSNGWISGAALEQHPWERLVLELGSEDATREDFDKAFVQKTAEEWEQWAKKRDLPLAALCDIP